MTKLNSDSAPKSGRGSESDRLSMSPQSLRRGGADPVDVDPSPVMTNMAELNLDKNDREAFGTDQWAAPGSGKPSAP